MLTGLLSGRMALITLATILSLTAGAKATVRRISGCSLSTVCVPLRTPNSGTQTVTPECWGMPVLEDAWTLNETCLGSGADAHYERESYLFTDEAGSITFVTKMKLAPRMDRSETTAQAAQDIFILPCLPRSPENLAGEDFPLSAVPDIILLDDITFPQVTLRAQDGPQEFLCAVTVPMNLITDFFLREDESHVELDWFVCADLDVTGEFFGQDAALDLDGNSCPDVAIEIPVLGFIIPRLGIDEIGAGLINFFLNRTPNGLTVLEVFGPQTRSFFPPTTSDHPYIRSSPPLLPGMQQGESGNTRPWCFRIDRALTATLDGGQVIPANGSPATGSGTFDIDPETNMLSYNIDYSGLSSPELIAALHGPAAPGFNGPAVFQLPLGSPKIGTWNYPESLENDIINGLVYLNIATDLFPAGEIRGQIE